jgi:hypothetical protein
MKLSDFIKRGQVKKSSKDITLAKSLIKTAKNDLNFLDSLEINEISARKIMSNYYDVLRSILEAISALDGYKIYSHEAFTYYLKEKNEDLISKKFDRLRKIRNQINYYGEDISVEEVKENVKEVKKLIEELLTKYIK